MSHCKTIPAIDSPSAVPGTTEIQDRGSPPATYPWFALRVRSKHERSATVHLRDRGYEEFCPTYKAQRQWSDRKKLSDSFLFPGYVFCRFNPQDRLPIITVPGVVGLVGFGEGPS